MEDSRRGETKREGLGENELVFHYDRARRLANAPASVRWLHEDHKRKRSFLSTLFPTRGLGLMALLVVISLIAYAIIGLVAGPRNLPHEGTIAGHEFSVHAASDATRVKIVVIRRTIHPSVLPLDMELRYGIEGSELKTWYDTIMPSAPIIESYVFDINAEQGTMIVDILLDGATLRIGTAIGERGE